MLANGFCSKWNPVRGLCVYLCVIQVNIVFGDFQYHPSFSATFSTLVTGDYCLREWPPRNHVYHKLKLTLKSRVIAFSRTLLILKK